MTTSTLHPGLVLADRRLVERLGTGGEGEVWRVARPDGGHCALKVLRPSVLPPADEVRRRGAWLVRIDHPAMVRVTRGGRFTGGVLQGWGFVEMDLVNGIALQSAAPLPDALDLLTPVAEALDLLHAGAWSDGVPLVHRDVKPGNLILTDHGLVLVDPSTLRGLDTTDLTRVGTPAYVAPEVASGRFGPLADTYSLAATAAALLTGRRGRGLAEVLAAPADAGLPAGVVAALDADPARRPATCAAVLRDGAGVAAAPSPPSALEPPATPGEHRVSGPAWAIPLLGLVLGVPAAAAALGSDVVGLVALGSAAVHLLLHAATGRLALGLLAPPWAWGDLVAGLGGPRGRRDRWLADVVAGILVLGAVATVVVLRAALPGWVLPAGAAGTTALVALARGSASLRGRVGWSLAWLAWLPLRVVGALPRVLIGGGADLDVIG